MWVRDLADKWTALGVRAEMPPEEVSRIRMANGIALLNGVFATLLGSVLAVSSFAAIGLSILLVPVLTVILLYIAFRGHSTLSRALTAPFLCLPCYLVGIMAGREVVLAIPFMLSVVPFSVFGLNEKKWLFSSLFVVSAISAQILIPGFMPDAVIALDPAISSAIQTATFGCVFLTVVALMFLSLVSRGEATNALEAARLQAEAADKTKSQFLANMSHEIRTPLAAIIGYAELLDEDDLPALDRQGATRTVKRNSSHLLKLVNQILDLSKIEAGELLLETEDTSLESVLADVMSLLRVNASENGLDLRLTFETRVPRIIYTDPLRLKQILVNLVGNAIKFTDEGSVNITVAIRESDGPMLTIVITDTGPGIAEWELERMFQPFVRGTVGVTGKGGTGLGLAISRRLASVLGGDVSARSTLGQGSSFRIDLPLNQVGELVDGSLAIRAPTREQAAAANLTGLKILICEDGQDNARLLAYRLGAAQAEVAIAENGKEGIRLVSLAEAEKHPFDVILMDMQMPVLDGYSAAATLRGRGCTVPIIALTAHAMRGDRERCVDAGCDDYLSKPVEFGVLFTAIDQLAGRRTPAGGSPMIRVESSEVRAVKARLAGMAADFAGTLDAAITEMRHALAEADVAPVIVRAHKIAGSAGMFGFTEVTESARRLEQAAGKGSSVSELSRLLDQFCEASEAANASVSESGV